MESAAVFLVLITYTQPLEAVEAVLAAHREYLQQHYAAGVFLLSGRKEPRDGGVILARANSAVALKAILDEDPFSISGVASYQIVEFIPTMSAPELATLLA
jgi:uncharacterized protein YciI